VEFKQMKGDDRVKIVMYALSTCIWCRKTKRLLNNLGVAYEYVDVDLLEGEEKETAQKDMKSWNPKGSFPTLIFDDKTCVVGFDEEKIREALVHE
jgi:glutaredoxin-like protein NrdH